MTTNSEVRPDSSKVVFFLGAGASKDAGVPTTFEFVQEFLKDLNDSDRNAVETVIRQLRRTPRATDGHVDVELLMETIERLSNAEEETVIRFCQDGRIKAEYEHDWGRILRSLRSFIRQRCQVADEQIQYLSPLVAFVQECKDSPLDVFSTNYDTCIEQLCKVHRMRYRDGFDPYWNPEDFDKPDTNIRLYKIHGSISWFKTATGEFVKNIFQTEDESTHLLSGEEAQPLMLYPMRKWEYQEPLLENLLTLKRKLQSKSCEIIVVAGYTFRDEYIRDIFWDAAKTNPDSVLVLIGPNAHESYCRRLKYYDPIAKTPSSLWGRVVCLPFKLARCFERLRLTIIVNLLNGAVKEKEARRQHLKEPERTLWTPCLLCFARALHVEKIETFLLERLSLEHVTPLDLADDKKLQCRWFSFVLSNLHEPPIDLVEIFHSRAMAHEFNGDVERYKVALYDLVTYVDWLFRTRMRFQFSHDYCFVTLMQHYPENWAVDLAPPLDLDALLRRLGLLRLPLYSFFDDPFAQDVSRRKAFSDVTKIMANLVAYFLRWKVMRVLDDYVTDKNEKYPEEMTLSWRKVKDPNLRVNEDEQGLRIRLLSQIDEYERRKFHVIIEDVVKHVQTGVALPMRDGLHDNWGAGATEQFRT